VEIVEQGKAIREDVAEHVDQASLPFLDPKDGITLDAQDTHISLREGRLFLATMELH
jgi:hypothetical protein